MTAAAKCLRINNLFLYIPTCFSSVTSHLPPLHVFIRFYLQSLLNCLLMLLAIIVICGVLLALQFPIVMSSPITALGFAALITGALGTVSTVVGQTLAPLPLFALILVSVTYDVCESMCHTNENESNWQSQQQEE